MKEYIIRLFPRSTFEVLPGSDTLFGAICWAIRDIYGINELEKFFEKCHRKEWTVTSCFPFLRTIRGKFRYLLPRPELKPLGKTDLKGLLEDPGLRSLIKEWEKDRFDYHSENYFILRLIGKYKEFSKRNWVYQEEYDRIINGEGEEDLFKSFLLLQGPEIRLTSETAVQKNLINRLTMSAGEGGETFYFQETSYRERAGCYFILKTGEFPFFQPIFAFLEDSGIGPNTKTGKNFFCVNWEETSIFPPPQNETTGFINLARFIPDEESLDKNINFGESCYRLCTFRSKLHSREEFKGEDVWKDRVRYLEEGSTFKLNNMAESFGSLFKVKELMGRTIYQNGMAYPVFVNINFGE